MRRDAARPRPMAACGWVRHGHCRRRASRPRTRRALCRRGSGAADQGPASCRDRRGYCAGRHGPGGRRRRSRTSLAQRSRPRLAVRPIHPLPGRQPAARGGALAFGELWCRNGRAPPAVPCGCAPNAAVFIGREAMSAECSSGFLPGNRRPPHPAKRDGSAAAGERGGGRSAPRARGMEWPRAPAAAVSRRE